MTPAAILSIQQALGVIASLMLTAYMFQKSAVVKDFDEYDFLIVGAGSAGSVIADRLSEGEQNEVLVIDAGGDPPIQSLLPTLFPYLPYTKYDWNFTSAKDNRTAQCHTIKALNLTSGHVLGGGSSVNYMMYVRGCPGDYDDWAEATRDSSWNYNGVFPYFIKSERLESPDILHSPYRNFHGYNGFLGITREDRQEIHKYLRAFEELGHKTLFDVNGESKLGYTLPLYTIADGIRQTNAYTNLGANKRRHNLHVLKDTLVTEILFDTNNRAIGVKAIASDGKTITIKTRKEVIISAGAINTPKLLMLSGIGPKQHLESLNIAVRSDLPVGLNFQDHGVVALSIKLEPSQAPPPPSDPHKFPSPLFIGYASLNKYKLCPEYQTFNFIIPHDSNVPYELCTFNNGFEESICKKILEAGKGHNTLYVYLNLLHPKSRGNITLRSVNPKDPPIVYTNTFSNVQDLEDLTSYVEDYIKVLNTAYFKHVKAEIVNLELNKCKDIQYGTREYWKCYVGCMTTTMCHFSGTCSMGQVVDSQLRVLNVRGLRIGDASVMPTLISGNINAPVIMIAEKLSAMIKQTYSSRKSSNSFRKIFYCTFFDVSCG